MNPLENKIDALEKKVDELVRSIKTIKKIFLWILIVTVVMFVLPLIGLVFVIPQFISTYTGALNGL
ncbi:MAG: hypothetical protein AAB938_00810 [Patescibacteria group bacterium]